MMSALVLTSSLARAIDEARVGLFIASVDPITEAHMDVIRAGIDQLHLNKIYIMVNSSSDKDYSASVDERIALVKTALKSLPEKNVTFEILSEPAIGKRNFAIEVAKNEGHGVIYQIAGQDVQPKAAELYAGVPEVKSYILPRMNPGDVAYSTELLPGFHLLNPTRVTSTSSTEVKELLEKGLSTKDMLDPQVLQEIVQKGLYFPLSNEEASLKSVYLGKRLQLLSNTLKNSPWSQIQTEILKPGQSFVVRTGAQAADNVSFNRIQSAAANDELMIRLLLKATPGLSKADQFQFRLWCLQEFQTQPFQQQKFQYEEELSRASHKSAVIVVDKNFSLPSTLQKMRELHADNRLNSSILILRDITASSADVTALQESLSPLWNVQVRAVMPTTALREMDAFLRVHQAQPILLTSSNAYNLKSWNYHQTSGGDNQCRSLFTSQAQ